MTLDQIEELIRKYLAMGVAVVVILTGVTPGTAPPSAAGTVTPSASSPPVVVLPDAAATMTRPPITTAPGSGSAAATGAAGSDPGRSDRSVEPGATGSPDGNWRAADSGVAGTPAAAAAGGEPGRAATADGAAAGSAAAKFGWGTPNRVEDFSGATGAWDLYNGPGHDGKGTRSPSAVSVADGIMTITGSPDGTTDGMAWNPGQKFGRWEARVRSPAGDPSYHAVLLLWPDAENWPAGGEVDFMENSDGTRQTTEMFLHYGSDNSQKAGSVRIDATQWHDWAVEWTAKGITAYVDGSPWWNTTDTSILPPGPMHLTIQLDWFPHGTAKQTQMSVDWVRQYPIGS